jgi:RHS repeat-associated protein
MGAALHLTQACSSGQSNPARPRLTLVASTPADQVAPSSSRAGHLQLVPELAGSAQQIVPERHLHLVPDPPISQKLETLSSDFESRENQQPCGFDGPEIPVIEYSYDDYGAQIATPGGDPYNPYRFQSQPLDEESGLYYLQARYYNPGLGKFIQADPLRYGAGLNLYDYCENDPINHSDPTGMDFRLDDQAGQSNAFFAYLTALTGYQFTRDEDGYIDYDDTNVNYEGTSGAAREIVSQMIDSDVETVVRTTDSLAYPGASTLMSGSGQYHQIDLKVIGQYSGVDQTLGRGAFLHEISEAYLEAGYVDKWGFSSSNPNSNHGLFNLAHNEALSDENAYYAQQGSALNNSGIAHVTRSPLGYSINLGAFQLNGMLDSGGGLTVSSSPLTP